MSNSNCSDCKRCKCKTYILKGERNTTEYVCDLYGTVTSDSYCETYFIQRRTKINRKQYDWLRESLNYLIDEIKDDETHSLAEVMSVISDCIVEFESEQEQHTFQTGE